MDIISVLVGAVAITVVATGFYWVGKWLGKRWWLVIFPLLALFCLCVVMFLSVDGSDMCENAYKNSTCGISQGFGMFLYLVLGAITVVAGAIGTIFAYLGARHKKQS